MAASSVPVTEAVKLWCVQFAPQAARELYLAGHLHVLHEQERCCQHLLTQMQSVSMYLTTGSNSSHPPPESSLPESPHMSVSGDEFHYMMLNILKAIQTMISCCLKNHLMCLRQS